MITRWNTIFLLEYIKHPRKVGAFAPSSKYLAHQMIATIDFETAKRIVEYGPGTGVFTEKILARTKETTIIVLIEINKEFYNILKEQYAHKQNVIIVNDSAENIQEILIKHFITHVDYILSGLPFVSLPQRISDTILSKTSEIIGTSGQFITFQYTLFKEPYIHSFFPDLHHKKLVRNLPPAYVLRCRGGNYESKNISSR